MKRFTNTEKWNNKMFRSLSGVAKNLLGWLNDHCDNAGIITPDLERAAFDIGEPINENHIIELKPWLKEISPSTYWIEGFIYFQFKNVPAPGTKSRMAPLHASIWNSLAAHNLTYSNPINASSQEVVDPSSNGRCSIGFDPSPKALSKGKGKGKEKGLGEKQKKPNLVYWFMRAWKGLYFERFKVVYADKKRDWSAVKTLLKATGKTPNELLEVAKSAWGKSGFGFWACENRTREICEFCNDWNKINAELYDKKSKRNYSGGSRTVADRNAGTLNNPSDYEGITEV